MADSINTSCALFSLITDVSLKKSSSKSSCNCFPSSLLINRESSKSNLFAINKVFVSGFALAFRSFSHVSKSSKLFGL